MHNGKLMHRDLKLDNYLVNPKNGYLQVTDFGTCTEITGKNETRYLGTIPYSSPELMKTGKHYERKVLKQLQKLEVNMANKGYNKETDLWAFGVSLYFMLPGKSPWHHKKNTKISCSDVESTTPNGASFKKIDLQWFAVLCGSDYDKAALSPFSDNVKNLIDLLLRQNLRDRLTDLGKIRSHCWFTEHDFDWDLLDTEKYQAPFTVKGGKLVENPAWARYHKYSRAWARKVKTTA